MTARRERSAGGSAGYAVDLRAEPVREATWELAVATQQTDAPVTITWPDLSELPNDLVAHLVDPTTGKRLYMRTARSYTFRSDAGGARRDFEVTFRVVCYAAGANVFSVIPICGGLMAWLWNAVLNVIGIREAHEISSGKAFLAYCLPAFVCCGFVVFVVMLALPEISRWFETAMP